MGCRFLVGISFLVIGCGLAQGNIDDERCARPLGSEPADNSAYEPMHANGGRLFANSLGQVKEDTVCEEVRVGVYAGQVGCTTPREILVSTWQEAEDEPSQPPILHGFDPAVTTVKVVETPIVDEYRVPLVQHLKAGMYPFVGIWTDDKTCAVDSAPACDDATWQWDGVIWSMVPGHRLYLGLGGCEPQ